MLRIDCCFAVLPPRIGFQVVKLAVKLVVKLVVKLAVKLVSKNRCVVSKNWYAVNWYAANFF
jgi:hypothetical protein